MTADGLDEAIRAAHDDLWPRLADLADAAMDRDPAFEERFDGWLRRHGYGNLDREAGVELAAKHHAVFLLGRALSPETVEADGDLFAAFPVDEEARRIVDDLRADVDPPVRLDDDPLGERYQAALPTDARRALGRFYTPPPVASILARWALRGGRRRVLDPAAGSGTVLAAAYDVLADRHPDRDPAALLEDLVAVDVDPVPLQLAAFRLAGRAGAGTPRTRCTSFFDLDPGEPVPGERVPDGDSSGGDDPLGTFDAVVGNPPYLRAEDLDAGHFRAHLAEFGAGTPYLDGDRAISSRSDAYVYFVTNATRFLREGGRLALVLPTKWLRSDYGEDLQRFLFEQYSVRAVVGFDGRTFDALVDTCLLLAERHPGGDDGPVKFVRAAEPADAGTALGAVPDGSGGIDGDAPRPGKRDGDGRRTIERRQGSLGTGEIGRYLTAPAELLALLEGPGFVPLSDLATVSRGVMTGANRFFFVDEGDRARWGIEDRFLRPARKSVRGLDTRSLDPGDVQGSIVDVHEYASSVGGDGAAVKRALAEDGHDGLLSYVRHAESEGWHAGRTCQRRAVWFDLGDLPVPDVFFPKLLRERVFVVANRAGAVPGNAVDCLAVGEGIDATALVGILESTLCKAAMEVRGRDEAGMLQLMTYETADLPVPDVRQFDPDERERVRGAATALLDGEDTRDELDGAVHDALDVDVSMDRVREMREDLLRRRLDGG